MLKYREEDVSSYWMTLRKREDTGSVNMEHQIALCGQLALEVYGRFVRLRSDDDDDDDDNDNTHFESTKQHT